jgi:hypothetical protein
MADGETRRRWQLRRDQGHRHVRLSLAHLGVPLSDAKATAVEDGGGHGGSRPRFGRLRRLDGGATLLVGPVSISGSRRTQNAREGRLWVS